MQGRFRDFQMRFGGLGKNTKSLTVGVEAPLKIPESSRVVDVF